MNTERHPKGLSERGLDTWNRFNKIGAFVFGAAGVVLNSEVLLGLASINIGEIFIVGGIRKWLANHKKIKAGPANNLGWAPG